MNFDINHESGLLGISGTSSDMRALIERQTNDVSDAWEVEPFCKQTQGTVSCISPCRLISYAG
jgi:acetate kinase